MESSLLTFLLIFLIALFVLLIISNWVIYEKAGKPGWACIIPIYSNLVLLQIVNKPWWWLLLMCIPYIGLIWAIWQLNLLSKRFGYDEGFTIGLIFLPFIFYPILAFGKSKYIPNSGENSKGDDFQDVDF